MDYKAILIHVPLANAQVQVELAARLAKTFGAAPVFMAHQ